MKGIQQACWALAVVAVLMSGCSGTPQVGSQAKQELRDSAKVKASAYEGAMVYYSLPSPLEVAYIVENSGINYEPGVLNKTELGVRYSTTKSQAINLGIYGSDLSYSILFNQQQVALKYLDCIKELSSGLDVTDTTSIKKLREMEDNIHDKDKLKKIVAQTFFHSDALLKENSRRPTAIMIVAGMRACISRRSCPTAIRNPIRRSRGASWSRVWCSTTCWECCRRCLAMKMWRTSRAR